MSPETPIIKKELTFTAAEANLKALAFMVPMLLLFGLPYAWLWQEQFQASAIRENLKLYETTLFLSPLLLLVITLGGIVVHELLHGLTWALFCKKGFSSIRFGVHWSALTPTPYCHCQEPLRLPQYALGGLMPGLLMGILPAIYGIATGQPGWWLFGVFFSIAAGGDLLILWSLRNQHKTDLVLDHPEKIGCYILEDNLYRAP